MRKEKTALRIGFMLLVAIVLAPSLNSAFGASDQAVPVSMVVSVEAKQGKTVPAVNREDVIASQGKDRLKVTDWVPLQGDKANLQLFILIDDATDPSIGLQFSSVKQFINAQPATTAIGIGYMRNGMVEVVQNLTKDHAQAAKALRLPMGFVGGTASPYLCVSDLMKRWPESPSRREIFMVSDGIDRLQPGPANTYLSEAISLAQRFGIQIYTIYASGIGHSGHVFWMINWGQNNLSQLADETGGEGYFQGFQTPISFSPFLDEFAERLKHQYRVTFLAVPQKQANYQNVRFTTEVSSAELVAAPRVYVPAAK